MRFVWILFFPISTFAAPIVLEVGQEKILPSVHSLRLDDRKVVRALAVGSGFKIIAVKPGFSSLILNNVPQDIHVLSKNQIRTQRTLEKWARERLGLALRLEKGELWLSGRLLRPKDWLGLLRICENCHYRARFEMADEVASDLQHELKVVTASRGLSSPALRWSPAASWIIRNQKPSLGLKQVANALGIELQAEEEAVDLKPLVRTQIFVLEAKRDRIRKWGLQWPNSVSAQVLPKTADPFSALSLTALALENNGTAKVLASPTLLCRSGREAEFFAGGEFPIKIVNLKTQGVVWKKYGILLRVKPTADQFGRMSLSLETEISSIDPARTVDDIPGLFTNRVLSHFDLAEPKTIAISGLIKSEDSQAMQGLPGLSGIPVLGALFGSRDFRENRSELLILVRPSVVSPDEASYD